MTQLRGLAESNTKIALIHLVLLVVLGTVLKPLVSMYQLHRLSAQLDTTVSRVPLRLPLALMANSQTLTELVMILSAEIVHKVTSAPLLHLVEENFVMLV